MNKSNFKGWPNFKSYSWFCMPSSYMKYDWSWLKYCISLKTVFESYEWKCLTGLRSSIHMTWLKIISFIPNSCPWSCTFNHAIHPSMVPDSRERRIVDSVTCFRFLSRDMFIVLHLNRDEAYCTCSMMQAIK